MARRAAEAGSRTASVDVAPETGPTEAPGPADATETPDATVAPTALGGVADEDPGEVSAETRAPEPATTPGPHLPWVPLTEASDPVDLDRLPGAGPALVWMLRASGIHSLADLAAAEADDLETRLGLVGALLDLPAWIEAAAKLRDRDAAP